MVSFFLRYVKISLVLFVLPVSWLFSKCAILLVSILYVSIDSSYLQQQHDFAKLWTLDARRKAQVIAAYYFMDSSSDMIWTLDNLLYTYFLLLLGYISSDHEVGYAFVILFLEVLQWLQYYCHPWLCLWCYQLHFEYVHYCQKGLALLDYLYDLIFLIYLQSLPISVFSSVFLLLPSGLVRLLVVWKVILSVRRARRARRVRRVRSIEVIELKLVITCYCL